MIGVDTLHSALTDYNDPNKSDITKAGDLALDAAKGAAVLEASELGAAAGEAAGLAVAGALLAVVPIGEICGPLLAPVLGSLGALVGGAVAGAVTGFVMDEAKELWDNYGEGAVKGIENLCDDIHEEASKVADWTEHVAEEAWHKGTEELKHINKVLQDKLKKVVNYIANTEKGIAEDADEILNVIGCDNSLGKNRCNANPLCFWCNNRSECWAKANST